MPNKSVPASLIAPESLKRMQREFLSHALPSESSSRGSFDPDSLIRPAGRLSAAEALEVYREGCVARFTEALGETYEAVWRVLGDDEFFGVCRSFIESHCSVSPNLSDYGEEFPEHLSGGPFVSEFGFLEDLARFERCFRALFHRAWTPPLTLSVLTDALGSGEELGFEFCPELTFFEAAWPVHDLWLARNRPDGQVHLPESREPERLWMHKNSEGEIVVHEAGETAWRVLRNLASGARLSVALEAALEDGWSGQDVSKFFSELMQSGVITGVSE